MFEITIKAETHDELVQRLLELATGRRVKVEDQVDEAPKSKTTPRKAKVETSVEEPIENDAQLQAELEEPVEPMPETAKAVVDAGTGKPVPQTTSDAPVKMTKDDVKAMAAKLAAKAAGKLGELLKKQGAAKLSEVPDAKLGDFASDVMEALG